MSKLDKAKESLIGKIDDLFGFNLSNRQDGISYDFGQYRLNKLYKPLVKYFIDQYMSHLEQYSQQEAEKILWLFSDFFSLYYSNWDFWYFKNKFSTYQYRIPYSGKDTEFWRATKDCYYVKTSDVVNDMAVSLWGIFENREVQIKMFKKTESIKTDSGEDKYTFDTQIEDIIDEESEEVIWYKVTFINYEESKDTKKQKETMISDVLESKWIQYSNPAIKKSIDEFLKKRGRDYFIHKRLKAFLTEELERYFFQMLKTDIQAKADILSIQKKIEEIKAKYSDDPAVIDFKIGQLMKESQSDVKLSLYETSYLWILNFVNILADLEEFKAKLWNKKRKIVKQEYCITIGKIIEYETLVPRKNEIFKEILSNEWQINEWDELLKAWHKHLDKITLNWVKSELQSWLINISKNMVVDTKYFDKSSKLYQTLQERWQKKLYEEWSKLDGILIKSENYQWLNVLTKDYKESIDMFYIDPPYNTWNDWFPYKDDFESSTWCSMIKDRLSLAKELSQSHTSLFSSIDDNENENLWRIIKDIYWEKNIETVIREKTDWRNNKINNNAVSTSKWIHEYIKIWFVNRKIAEFWKIFRIPTWKQEYWNPDNDPRGNWMSGIISLEEAKSDSSAENYYTVPNSLSKEVLEKIKNDFWIEFKREITREWYISPKQFETLLLKNEIYIPKWWEWVPRIKIFVNQPKAFDFESIIKNIGDIKDDEMKSYLYSRLLYWVMWSLWSMWKSLKEELLPMFWLSYHLELEKYTPKPLKLIQELIRVWTKSEWIVCDFFSGTWTTGIATIKLNHDDNSKWTRKFIVMEIQDWFEKVIVPRFKKTIFSKEREEWKPKWIDGYWWYFSYLYLNQYENRFNAWWYLDNLEWDINQLSNTDVTKLWDIKQILFPLSQLKDRIYGLDDE